MDTVRRITLVTDMPVIFKEVQADKIYQVRVGKDLNKYGDKFEFSFMMEVNGNHALLTLGSGSIGLDMLKEVMQGIYNLGGIDTISWERYRDGGSVHIAGPYRVRGGDNA